MPNSDTDLSITFLETSEEKVKGPLLKLLMRYGVSVSKLSQNRSEEKDQDIRPGKTT